MVSEGPLSRSDLHRRLIVGFDALIEKKFRAEANIWPDDKPIPLSDGTFIMPNDLQITLGQLPERPFRATNVEKTLNRLQFCPVDGAALRSYSDEPYTRSCDHGTFRMTEISQHGDVYFTYLLIPEDEG